MPRPSQDLHLPGSPDNPSDLLFSSFLGGVESDSAYALALDGTGQSTVAGYTASTNFPTTPGAFDTGYNHDYDAFVTRFSTDGRTLRFSTFLGGRYRDIASGIAVDSIGRTIVTGATKSFDFPTTPGAFDRSFNGTEDVFVVRLNAEGSALDYGTFLGGSGEETSGHLVLDRNGRATVTGSTVSGDFPTTPGAFDQTHNGNRDTFVARLNSAGSALDYATFLGGSEGDLGRGLAIDGADRAILTGTTNSSNFPTTLGAYDRSFNGYVDIWIVRLNAEGSALDYSTLLGGSDADTSYAVTSGNSGHAYVTGYTHSFDFPTTPGAFDTGPTGYDAYVVRLSAAGNALDYSTFVGSAGYGLSIISDASGRATLLGYTDSASFPTTPGAFDRTYNGGRDAFVARLNHSGSILIYGTYLGGEGFEDGGAIALDSTGRANVAGYTESSGIPHHLRRL